jgi:hypothetical protein
MIQRKYKLEKRLVETGSSRDMWYYFVSVLKTNRKFLWLKLQDKWVFIESYINLYEAEDFIKNRKMYENKGAQILYLDKG